MDPLCRRVLESSANPLAELELLLADPPSRSALLGHAGGALLQAAVDSLSKPDSAGCLAPLTDLAERLVDLLPPAVSLAALLARWRACQSGRSLSGVVRLTVRFLTGYRIGAFLRGDSVGPADAAEDDAVLRWLINLPTVAANRMALEAAAHPPDLLTQPALGRLLSNRLLDCLAGGRVHWRRCSMLAGLLCLHGRAEEFWTSAMGYSTGPADAVANLLAEAQPAHLESLLTWPVANCSNFVNLRRYFGRDLVARDAAAPARLLLSDKLLFVRHFQTSLAARNLARYLHWADFPLFCRALLEAGRVWSQPAVVRSNGLEQHRHVTWFLVVGARLLAARDDGGRCVESAAKSVRDQLVSILVPGIAAHFEHNADSFRDIGMATGEAVTDLLRLGEVGDSGDQDRRLKFDQASCPDAELIKRLAYGDLDFANDYELMKQKVPEQSLLGTPLPRDEGDAKQSLLAPVEPLDSDDEEDSESLRPIPASLASDGPAPDPHRPRYIRQLLDGLRSTAPEERDRLRASLIAARQLISQHPGAVRELSLDLANALLNLNASEDDGVVDGFAEKRLAALTELVCSDPDSVAPHLADQVFLPDYCTSQRLDALLALQTAALSLSKAKPAVASAAAAAAAAASTPATRPCGRVTRRWGRRTASQLAAPSASANAFSRHAGAFFFGLARGFDTRTKQLDLAGPDHPVLCRLLYTLGVVYFCAENAPGQARMLATLAELLPVIARHPEAPVRRGVLFCYACLGLATPVAMATDLAVHSANFGELFSPDGYVANEPDAECRQLAVCAGKLLAARLSDAWQSALAAVDVADEA